MAAENLLCVSVHTQEEGICYNFFSEVSHRSCWHDLALHQRIRRAVMDCEPAVTSNLRGYIGTHRRYRSLQSRHAV